MDKITALILNEPCITEELLTLLRIPKNDWKICLNKFKSEESVLSLVVKVFIPKYNKSFS